MQESLSARGPKFAILPKYPQGSLCQSDGGGMHQTPPSGAENSHQTPATYSKITVPNLTIEEHRTTKELKEDQSLVVLTVDKGVAMVVMDKENYTDKALYLLQTPVPTGSSKRTHY